MTATISSPTVSTPLPRDGTLTGIALACSGFLLYTCMDAVVKLLSAGYPLHQIVLFNALFALIPALAYAMWNRGLVAELTTQHPYLHLCRALLGVTGAFTTYYAYSRLPLSSVYVIIFASPLFITALSVPILREPVGWRRWSAVVVGFGGILLMLRPGVETIDPGAIGAIFGALGYASTVLMVRRFGATEGPVVYSVFGNLTAVTVGLAAALFLGIVVPPPGDLAIAAMGGILGGTASLVVVAAFRRAPAGLLAPFQYTQMGWGVLFGAVLWGDLPDGFEIAGFAIVVASGLYTIHRERVVRRRQPAA